MNPWTWARIAFLALGLFCPLAAFGQQAAKTPTLRDEVRGKGLSYRIFINDSEGPSTFDRLIAKSDVIVLGRVVDEKTRLSHDEQNVLTDYTIEVTHVFKDVGRSLKEGDRIVATRMGGNLVLEGHPVRDENLKFPPLPWITPHIFFLRPQKDPDHKDWYDFTSEATATFPILNGHIECGSKTEPNNPLAKPFCGKSEQSFESFLEEKITAQAIAGSAH